MARSSTMTSYGVSVNLEPAVQELEKLQDRVKTLTDKMSKLKEKMTDPSTWGPKDTINSLNKQYERLQKDLDGVIKTYEQGVKRVKGIDSMLENISGANYDTLTSLRTTLTNTIKRRRLGTEDEVKAYEEAAKRLQKVRDEIAKRDIDVKGNMTVDKSKEVLTKPEDFSTRSINEAIEAMTKLRNIQQADSEEWHNYNNLVKQGSQYLEEFNRKIKTLDMSKVHEGIQTGNISDKDLNTVIRYWESIIEGADKSDEKLSEFNAKLEEARKLQQQRFQQKGESIVQEVKDGNLGGSLGEMQQRLKILQDYRNTIDSTKPDAFVEVDKAIGRITATIKESQPGFMSFEAAMEKAADIKNFKGTIDELEKIKRTIQEGTTGLALKGKTLETLKEAQLRLDDIADKYKEIQHLNAQKKIDAVSNAMKSEEGLATLSAGDTEEAIRLAKELQKSHDTTGKEYQKLSVFITNAEAQLKKWNDSAKQTVMNKQLQDLTHLSKTALEEQQKFWQGAVDGAERGSQAYEYAAKRLQKVNDQMAVRQMSEANAVIKEINTDGNMGGSLSEMQQRLKLLQEYRTAIDSTKPNAYIEVDKAIASLNQRIKESQAGFMSFDEALEKAKAVAGGTFDGTVEDLEKIQKVLKEGMGEKKLDLLGQADLKEAHSGLDAIAVKLKEIANINAQDKIDAVGANIAAHSPAEIEEAVRLAKELQKSHGTSTRQYKELAVFITEAESQLKKWNDQVKQSFMQYDLSKVTSMSDTSLAEQKKYWQEMVNGTEAGSAALQTYKNNLQTVIEEERKRTQAAGKDIVTQYETGNWDKTIGETREAIKQLQAYRDTLRVTGESEDLQKIDKAIEGLTLKTKRAEQGFLSLDEAMERVADIDNFDGTLEDLDKIQKAIKEGMSTQLNLLKDEDVEKMKMAQLLLDDISKKQKEIATLSAQDKISAVSANLDGSSVGEIEETVKLAKELQKAYAGDSVEFQNLSKFIKEGTAKIDAWNARIERAAMSEQFKRLTQLSTNALAQQKKYWQDVFDNAEKGSAFYIQAERKLQAIDKEITNRESTGAGRVMNNMQDYSVSEIEAAIKATEKLRDAQKAGSAEYEIYAEEIKKAKEYLQSYMDLSKQVDMEDKWANLASLSANALAEQKKYWQEMVNGAQQGSRELTEYQKKLKAVSEEEQKRTAANVRNIMQDPNKYSVTEIRDAIKATEQLRDAQRPGSSSWKNYAEQVERANDLFTSFKDKAKMAGMISQYRDLSTLSKSALSEQKKFWQAMADGASKGSKELSIYENRLKAIRNEENARTKSIGKELAKDVLSGVWSGTVGESKEAIKTLKEYKDTLAATDTAGIKRVDKAISELSHKSRLAETGFRNTNEALNALVRQTKNLESGNFKGSIAELEEMRRKLITIRETQDKVLSAKDRDRLAQAIKRVDKELGLAKGDLLDINHVLSHMRSTPLKTLERAAAQLQSEIRDCSEATTDFATKAAQLRRVNAQVDKLKKTFKEKESVITRTAKRLAAYVAIYGGFNFAIGKIKEMIKANLQLSDSFADIQKTTELPTEEIKELSKSIDSIDTRTSQQQLHELAAVAGQLGLKSQTDILGFVKASNMISVSLNELGSEGTSSLMKIATLTGEASEGTEQALLKIGSAINELTANSSATAGPIVDLMNRMGGVAAQANLTSAQMAAIGATANALGQSMEITGTSMNKFLTSLMSSSDNIAYALNMDAKALREMLESGNTMGAMIAVFEKMKGMGGLQNLAGIMGDLGSEGARMTQVLSAMASRVDFLKAQVDLSTEAYKDATSIQDEYNIKNENALAVWERIGNMIKELFVNSWFVDILTGISKGIYNVLSLVIESEYFFKILASSIAAVTTALYANSAAWVKNLNAMGLVDGFNALMSTITNKFMAVWDTLAGAVKGGAKSFAKFTKEAWAAAEGTNAFKKATDLLGTSLKKLGNFLSRNWLTITLAALAAMAAWVVTNIMRVTELTRAMARYHREIEEEKNNVDALFTSLKRLNNTEADRAKIIDTINRKYGDYLGFMLSEKDSAEQLAAAHKLINSELERRMALNLQNTLQGKANNVYAEKYEEEATDIEQIIRGEGLFNSSQFKGKVTSGEVKSFISNLINDAVTSAVDNSGDYRKLGEIDEAAFMESVKQSLIQKFNYAETKIVHGTSGATYSKTITLGEMLFDKLEGNIEDLLEARIEYMEDIFDAERDADLEIGRITKNASKDRQDMLKVTQKEIEQLKNTTIQDSWTEEQTQEHYKKLLNSLRSYIDQSKTMRKNMTDDERKLYEQGMIDQEKAYKTYYNKIAPLAGEDPWGKNMNVKDWQDFADVVTNLDTSSADALVSAYKQLTEDTAKIPSNVKAFYKMFEGTGLETKLNLQDPKDVALQVHNWAEQIKNKLKDKYGRNTSGGFIFDSEGSVSKKKKAQEEYRAALAALEAYFNERETLIQKKGFEEGKTQVQINQDLERLQTEKLNDEIQLRKLLLDDYYKESTFNPSKYKGVISGTDYFKEKNLEYLAALRVQLEKWGVAMEDGMKKQLTDRMVKLYEQALKLREKINKILLEDNFSEQVKQQYLDSLQELGLLFGLTEQELVDQDKQEGLRRLAYMREWAKESYNLNAQQLQLKIEQEKAFSLWRIGRSAEDYEALLMQLRKFHDDQEEADRKAAERRKKIFDNSEKGIQLQKEASSAEKIGEAGVKNREDNVKFWDRFKNMDLVTDDLIDEKQVEVAQAQLSLYQAKIDASQLYIDQIKKEMEAEQMKARMAIAEAQNELNRKKMMHADTTQAEADLYAAIQYYESLKRQESLMTKDKEEEIAQARAEQVEQYQEIAARNLAIEQNKINRMKEYTDAVVDFSYQMGEAAFGEVEDRKEAGKQLIKSLLTTLKEHLQIQLTELAMEAMFANQSNAIRGREMITNLTASGMEAGATVDIEGVKATAKETGKLGWKGLLVGAAISAALSALLGVAMGALNKKKSEIASTTGASTGRLATGMLTYAQGNYPVLGNDGQVYNAKYEGSEMKTGVYGGGAHFGIFSEKKPEAIIDGDTTQRLILYHPDIWQSILTLSKTGRLDRGMRTFASGNMSDFASMDIQPSGDNASVNLQNEMMEQLRALMTANMTLLNKLATEGVHSRIDMYGEGGLYKSMKKAETFASKRGYR